MTLCRDCQQPYHPHESCQAAADRRADWAAITAYVDQQLSRLATLAGRTPMSEVPPALRGPNWPGPA
ncbi:hypothetical protein [Streptomyces sp. BK340]|uniref:hypothetical protein n=1 Tax=Streptomyces sp. BK340 TaxID=2572903 RepID=UPI00119DEF12|nr:hypothetical protein [Streptomyces sp. BK340]TVZ96490.1 hypothetical protein FB157_103401 [Streptomyces sp. BK340]